MRQSPPWHGGRAAARRRRLADGWKRVALGAATALGLAGVLLCAGCGSFQRSIPFGPLSAEDMRYADTLPMVGRGRAGARAPFDATNMGFYVVPTFPVIYSKKFVRYKELYGLERTVSLLIVAGSQRGMLFDDEGLPLVNLSVTSVALLGGWERLTYYDEGKPGRTGRRLRLIELPIVSDLAGPCLGFGTGYLKILWIPFINNWPPDARAAPEPPQPPSPAPPAAAGPSA